MLYYDFLDQWFVMYMNKNQEAYDDISRTKFRGSEGFFLFIKCKVTMCKTYKSSPSSPLSIYSPVEGVKLSDKIFPLSLTYSSSLYFDCSKEKEEGDFKKEQKYLKQTNSYVYLSFMLTCFFLKYPTSCKLNKTQPVNVAVSHWVNTICQFITSVHYSVCKKNMFSLFTLFQAQYTFDPKYPSFINKFYFLTTFRQIPIYKKKIYSLNLFSSYHVYMCMCIYVNNSFIC